MVTKKAVYGLCAVCIGFTLIDVAAVAAALSPFHGSPIVVPGTIELEDFDDGGESVAYHDATVGNEGGGYRNTGVDIQTASGGGWNIGWVSAGEWLAYTVDVGSTGAYQLDVRVASADVGGRFHVEAAGVNVTGTLTVPNTGGWQSWVTVSAPVSLNAGRQVMRVVFDTDGRWAVGNFDRMRISSNSSDSTLGAAPVPFTGQPVTLPGTIRAENFDVGGEGVAYHDTTAGNSGGQYRPTDVDLQASSLGLYNVGWTSDGEWLSYAVNVTASGSYTFRIEVASPLSAGRLHVSSGSVSTPVVSVPNTGGWQTWTTVDLIASLSAGPQTLRLVIDVGGFNVAGITATLTQSAPAPPSPPAGPPSGSAPLTYGAPSDREPRPKPPIFGVGAAGSLFADPTFGSTILRVTDGNTRPASPGISFRTPSASPQMAWNSASTYFYVVSTDGNVVPYALDATAMRASRIPSSGGDGGLTLNFNVEPQFSTVNPNVIFGIISGGNNRTVAAYDFSTGGYTPILNLDTVIGGLSGYVGGVMTGGGPVEYMTVFFGGSGQDRHRYLMWFPVNNPGARKIVDTVNSTINGIPTSVWLNFHLHAVSIDKSGRYVLMYPTGPDHQAPRYASQVYVWDTANDAITALTSGGNDGQPNTLPGGHATPGYGFALNQDCCVSSLWDGAQWVMRSLAAPLAPWDLIGPVLRPVEIYFADHTSWGNAKPDAMVPVISGTYRYGDNTTPWRAWDEEIIAIATNAPAAATVWRFAHHRSDVRSDANPAALDFWSEPRPTVSPNGRWVLFTSNWEKTLGMDPRSGTHRQDVFLVQLR